ncbi:MAG TPA: lipopolysaccharide kinase InaA family protein [Flavobacteriaceae bacterium]|nr:lipopolysaccharide kinase InaA family protein [Flavobacteriaceae bacterium]
MKVVIADTYKTLEPELRRIIATYENTGKLLYDGSRNSLKKFPLQDKEIVVKAFGSPNLINRIVYRFFRKSKAERSFFYAKKLASFDIGTPKAIAYMENTSFLFFKDSYYISEYLESDLTYRELITYPDYPDKEEILLQFTAFTKKLHDNCVLFKDHSPGNTLIKKTGQNSYAFYLVDLNRMEFKDLTYRERILNFTRLTPEKEMIRTMAYAYADLCDFDPDDVFRLMWEETEKFQNKFHKKRRIKRRVFFWKEKYKE